MSLCLFYLPEYGSLIGSTTRRITWPYYISKMPIYSRLFCIFPNDISHLVFSVFWWDYWLLLTFSRQLISSVFETLFWLMLTGVMRRLRRRRKMKTGFHTHRAAAGILSKEGSIEKKTRILTINQPHVDDTRVVWNKTIKPTLITGCDRKKRTNFCKLLG